MSRDQLWSSAQLCRIRLYGVKSAGYAGAKRRPAGGTFGAVLGRQTTLTQNVENRCGSSMES